jgi:hypothetical protein
VTDAAVSDNASSPRPAARATQPSGSASVGTNRRVRNWPATEARKSVVTRAPPAVGAVIPRISPSIAGPTAPNTPETANAAIPAVAAGRKTGRTPAGTRSPAKSSCSRRRRTVSGSSGKAARPATISTNSTT